MNPAHGGPCQGIRYSIPELEKLGVHNEVLCLDHPQATFIASENFKVHAVGPSKTPWQFNVRLFDWLLKNLLRFDVVIIHGLWLYHGYAVREAVKRLSKQRMSTKSGTKHLPKLFIMPHGMLDPYFQTAPGRKIKAIRNWIYWKLIESKVVNEANGLLFTCERELELARLTFQPYMPKQEKNVGYGIAEPPSFSSHLRKTFLERCPIIAGQPYLLFLSRIHEKKGIDILIQAYIEVLKNINKIELNSSVTNTNDNDLANYKISKSILPKLVIAGPGMETVYGQKIKQMVIGNQQLCDSIVFPGMLSGDAKWGAIYGCEAFVLPSHQENFGIAVVEALACGKPVLISNQINIWKEINNMGGGMITTDTLKGLQELLNTWLGLTVEKKREMSVNAREAYEKKFAIGQAASNLIDAIKD